MAQREPVVMKTEELLELSSNYLENVIVIMLPPKNIKSPKKRKK